MTVFVAADRAVLHVVRSCTYSFQVEHRADLAKILMFILYCSIQVYPCMSGFVVFGSVSLVSAEVIG